ncbi:vWA domain-containing protein [Phytohabitans rumicis]|uniref:VWFA domain-containing protein n=1 Tax=Phytohabitans rumicis TaxID=1076125 RepID=A0A6V8KN20_9ACTN|nr:VWA domain-containing protein [Phytohabitans rumicis]GFJ86562.1 hypothetical protein Prum_002040 [Phytohabitans rumicis]
MPDWIRRDFGGVGLTQSPPGRHLAALQARYRGSVLLCIDVSSSMGCHEDGRTRVAHAVAGAERFVNDAVGANYDVGLVLWNSGIVRHVPLSRDPRPVLDGLRQARAAGGTNVNPALRLGIQQLGSLTGDRVMAIFGDGDIGPVAPALASSREAAALGIRIIVRGLGEYAAGQMAQIATEDAGDEPGAGVVHTAADIEHGIAGMAGALGLTALSRRGRS